MKFKSKFNVGDVVLFYNRKICDNDIGKIDSIKISFSWETMLEEKYVISPARIEEDYSYKGVEVEINSIHKKLNKKAFERAFAEKCAKYLTHQHKGE